MEQTDIRQWVAENAEGLMPKIPFTLDELDHIAMCMHHIYKWYREAYPLGDFLTAVVRNDFSEACFQADDANRKALYLYALFLSNKLPLDYRKKALAKAGGKGMPEVTGDAGLAEFQSESCPKAVCASCGIRYSGWVLAQREKCNCGGKLLIDFPHNIIIGYVKKGGDSNS